MKIRISKILFLALILIFAVTNQAIAKEIQIGVIMSSSSPYFKATHKAFSETLKLKGINAEVILQIPAPDIMAWINAARKFSAIGTDIVITYGSPATHAVISEAPDIPLVFTGVYDFKHLGVSAGKVTGINSKVSIAGLLKSLKGINNFSSLAILYSSAEKNTLHEVSEIERLESQFSFRSRKINVRSRNDIFRIKDVDAILITTSCIAMNYIDDIVSIARKLKIPTAAMIGGGEDEGIILTFAADPEEQGREAAEKLTRIIKGESPSSIPVENPKKINLIVNMKEASSSGFKIPFDILSAAARVIK